MTGPLVVLGVFSAIGGLHQPAAGSSVAAERWSTGSSRSPHRPLSSSALEMPHGSTEFFLIGAAVAIGAVGLVRRVVGSPCAGDTLPAAESPADTGLARVLYRKYYVDEIYDAVIVRPLIWLSRVVLWRGVDQGVVDGAAVNGTAKLSRGLGWLGSRLQTGQVGIYVVLFLVGALWILHAMVR